MNLNDFIPPIMDRAVRRLLPAPLFDGHDEMFRREAVIAKCYGEYGMGASTKWVLSNTRADVIAVDTSEAWVESVRVSCPSEARLSARWVDVGPVAYWGYPISYRKRAQFSEYREEIWRDGRAPDLVLVDGRFRVACFLTSLMRGQPGGKIIFDDYTDRPHYHVVEEIVSPVEFCGRQALFVIPSQYDPISVPRLLDQFALVRD